LGKPLVRLGDYKLIFSNKFKKDAWYNCSRHSGNTNINNSSMEEMDYHDYDDEDLNDDDDEDEDDEDDDEVNYIHLDSDLKKHHNAVKKFDR